MQRHFVQKDLSIITEFKIGHVKQLIFNSLAESRSSSVCTLSENRDSVTLREKLIGSNMKVNSHNLITPASSRLLRKTDIKHVDDLKLSIKARPNLPISLLGNIADDIPLNMITESSLLQKNFCRIETLGGNHTRVAIQELESEGFMTERMNIAITIYYHLTDSEALQAAYDHNVINELGRPTTAEDLMHLFYSELERARNCSIQTQSISNTWKNNLAFILGITREKLHNVYHTMLSLASCSKECWAEIETFMQQWSLDTICKKPKGSLKKAHFKQMSLLKTDEDRIQLLRDLNKQKIDWPTFNQMCSSYSNRKKKGTVNEESAGEQNVSLTEQNEMEDSTSEPRQHNVSQEVEKLSNKIKELDSINLELTKEVRGLKVYKNKFLQAEVLIDALTAENNTLRRQLELSKSGDRIENRQVNNRVQDTEMEDRQVNTNKLQDQTTCEKQKNQTSKNKSFQRDSVNQKDSVVCKRQRTSENIGTAVKDVETRMQNTKKVKSNNSEFVLGERVWAKYTDGVSYPAKIKEINRETNFCTVQYIEDKVTLRVDMKDIKKTN